MSKEELGKMTAKSLIEMCKERGIPYSNSNGRLKKSELIEALSNDMQEQNSENVVKNENPETMQWVNQDKEKYIEEAEVGTLIAFYDKKGKPRTAALVNRSSTRRVVKVVTEFGWEFIVPYESVLWVRKGNRWPKGVYNLLKGYNRGEE